MKGWKTWVAAVTGIGTGIYLLHEGYIETRMGFITGGMALIGIGHKIEKSSGKDRGVLKESNSQQ